MPRRFPLWPALIVAAALLLAVTDEVRPLYDKALKALYAGRYDEAEGGFATVYRLQPDAPYAPDAAFKAGEAAYRQERFDAAAQHFGHYLRAYPLGAAVVEARERLAQAKEKIAADHPPLPLPAVQRVWPRAAAAWAVDGLPAKNAGDVEHYIAALAKLGYNALAVPAFHLSTEAPLFDVEPTGAAGAYFATTAAPVRADRLAELVVTAHKFKMRLIAVLPVRSLVAGLDEALLDRRWNAETRTAAPDPLHADLFAAGALERLAALAADAAQAGPDAIWFGGDLAFAPDEGVSPGALAALQKTAPAVTDAAMIFIGLPTDAAGRIKQGGPSPAFAAFCEARARRALEALAAMAAAARRVHPSCRFAAIAPIEAVEDPIAGLRETGVDMDGLAKLPLDQVIVTIDPRVFQLARGLTRQKAYASLAAISARLLQTAVRHDRGVVVIRAQTIGAARALPAWEIAECLTNLLAAGPFGIALAPPPPGQPVAPWLEGKPAEAAPKEEK